MQNIPTQLEKGVPSPRDVRLLGTGTPLAAISTDTVRVNSGVPAGSTTPSRHRPSRTATDDPTARSRLVGRIIPVGWTLGKAIEPSLGCLRPSLGLVWIVFNSREFLVDDCDI